MNRLVLSVILSAFALGATAQTPTPAPDATVQVQDKSAEVTVVTGDADKINERNCLRETGSHVLSKNRKTCISANGRSYTRADIDRTGAIDLADALRRLDPGVSIQRN